MYRSWPERQLEAVLSSRRRQEVAEERRKARRNANEALAQGYAPGPRRRAIAGEVINGTVGSTVTTAVQVVRGWRNR